MKFVRRDIRETRRTLEITKLAGKMVIDGIMELLSTFCQSIKLSKAHLFVQDPRKLEPLLAELFKKSFTEMGGPKTLCCSHAKILAN